LGINEIFPAIQQHDVKALFIVGDHSAYDDGALHILPELELLVVQDLFMSDLAAHADVVLPMPAFTEQYGSYTSLDRRIQMVRPVNKPLNGVWNLNQILSQIALQLGNSKMDQNGDLLLREISNLVTFYRGISYEKLEERNVQWPIAAIEDSGASYLFSEGFQKRKAILAHPKVFPRPQVSLQEFPLLYAPGRVLAQPQREVEVIRSGRRNAISREEAIEIHPEDAKGLHINAGDAIEVVTPLQRVRGLARLTAPLKGVVSATFLFGGLASEVDQSGEMDPMLRIPGLFVVPSRLEKITP
jgi:formate dehydrogenase major subunit